MKKPKTYAEEKGVKPFNWMRFLKGAIKKNPSTEKKENAELLAHDWVTCACGNQCSIIPRDERGMPRDYELECLGGKFYAFISLGLWNNALSTIRMIEARSEFLIAKILNSTRQSADSIESPDVKEGPPAKPKKKKQNDGKK